MLVWDQGCSIRFTGGTILVCWQVHRQERFTNAISPKTKKKVCRGTEESMTRAFETLKSGKSLLMTEREQTNNRSPYLVSVEACLRLVLSHAQDVGLLP